MLTFAGQSDVGCREGENEDSIGWDEAQGIWLVADGMGGHVNGRMASGIVRERVLGAPETESVAERLLNAHRAIIDAAAQDASLTGMGSTVVVARIAGAAVEICWVGDSRAYRWRPGGLDRLSRDHSFVELLREHDHLSEEQVRADPRANLVTQTLGHGDPVPAVRSEALRQGDRILLCSDGLNDELSDDEIALILREESDAAAAVERLVDTAIEHGGKDNTSAVLIDFGNAGFAARLGPVLAKPWVPVAGGITLALLVVLLVSLLT